MAANASAGARLRAALAAETPLQVVGTINAYTALLAERARVQGDLPVRRPALRTRPSACRTSASRSLNDVCEDVRRITSATELPLLVDADTGWGAAFNISRTIADLVKSGAAGCHLEDQVQAKRCGHRPGKALVSGAEMVDRIKAAVDGAHRPRLRDHGAHRRACESRASRPRSIALVAYVEAGADMIFAEAFTSSTMYRKVHRPRAGAGAREHHRVRQDASLSRSRSSAAPACRHRAASAVGVSRDEPGGAQRSTKRSAATAPRRTSSADMQTRDDLYKLLDYHAYERKLDELFSAGRRRREPGMSTRHRPPASRRSPSRCRASRPATPRCARSATPATICTIAATTFSTSPRTANSKRSPIC